MTLLAVLLALLGQPTVTHDVLPVVVPSKNAAVVVGEDTWGGGPPIRLGVFRRPARPGDALPAAALGFARFAGGHVDRSRLLIAAPGFRIYAYPADHREVCFAREPNGGGMCTESFLDGAYPAVDARRDVWGIVDDAAVGVDVTAAHRTLRARLGRNAFYLRLPAGTVAPETIVVRERGGGRHVYTIERCTTAAALRQLPVTGPLAPPGC